MDTEPNEVIGGPGNDCLIGIAATTTSTADPVWTGAAWMAKRTHRQGGFGGGIHEGCGGILTMAMGLRRPGMQEHFTCSVHVSAVSELVTGCLYPLNKYVPGCPRRSGSLWSSGLLALFAARRSARQMTMSRARMTRAAITQPMVYLLRMPRRYARPEEVSGRSRRVARQRQLLDEEG